MTAKKKLLKPQHKGAKKKDPNKSKAALAKKKNDASKAVRGKNPGAMMRDLLLEKKYTDEEIFAKVSKAFPDKTVKQTYCNNWRHWINHLSGMKSTEKNPVERLYKHEGKLVKKSDMPKPERKAKKKYTEENDPLKKVAGINVHNKNKKSAKKKVAKKS